MRVTRWRQPARPLMSRYRAFEMRGVSLKYPSRSWSGVRADDGAIVLALWAGDIFTDADGSRCLLWSAQVQGAQGRMDRPSSEERLRHCRLAASHGGAEGLLVYGDDGVVDPEVVISLRVLDRSGEYWARWGSVTHLAGRRPAATPSGYPLRLACG